MIRIIILLVFLHLINNLVPNTHYKTYSFQQILYRIAENKVKKVNLSNFQGNIEFKKYEKREFTKFIENSRFYKYLQDEKEMMLSTLNNTFIPEMSCDSHQSSVFINS